MKLKIVSDGTRQGTRVLDAETGEGIADLHILGLNWSIGTDAEAQPMAILTCRSVEVDLEIDASVEQI